jgi:hypothetical protein
LERTLVVYISPTVQLTWPIPKLTLTWKTF